MFVTFDFTNVLIGDVTAMLAWHVSVVMLWQFQPHVT